MSLFLERSCFAPNCEPKSYSCLSSVDVVMTLWLRILSSAFLHLGLIISLGKMQPPPLLVEGDVELICFPGWRRPFRKQAARFHHWFSYDERNHSGGRRLSVLSSCGNGITALRYFRDPFLRLCILVGWGGGIQSRGAEGAFPPLATSVSVRGLHEFRLWHFPDGPLKLHPPYCFIIYCWLLGVSFNVWVWEHVGRYRDIAGFLAGLHLRFSGELME